MRGRDLGHRRPRRVASACDLEAERQSAPARDLHRHDPHELGAARVRPSGATKRTFPTLRMGTSDAPAVSWRSNSIRNAS